MRIGEAVHSAFANMGANRTRCGLAALGIAFSTAAVMVVAGIANAARLARLAEWTAGMENTLILRTEIEPGAAGRVGRLLPDELRLLGEIPGVDAIVPIVRHEFPARGSAGTSTLQFVGVERSYPWKMLAGHDLRTDDAEGRGCLVTAHAAERLFGRDNPVGQRIRLANDVLRVVGVVPTPDPRSGESGDVILPVDLLMRLAGDEVVYAALVRCQPGETGRVRTALETRLARSKTPLVHVENPLDAVQGLADNARRWLLQTVLIAALSLLVGGIGLMNFFVGNVAERAREIGIRRSVGASARMIARQFLIESALLSGAGGVAGVLAGWGISFAVNTLSRGAFPVSVPPAAPMAAVLFSLGAGVVFGLFPASRAAALSPAEALRSE